MNEFVSSGHPCWVDLSTSDIAAADRFYRELFGWDVVVNETPMGAYHVGRVEGRDVAGMMAQPAEMHGAPSVWTTYFFVDELDPTLREIEAAGGSVLQPPFEIPDGARVSIVADSAGAMFALLSGLRQPGPYLSAALGAVSWVELMTRTPEVAERFYERVFGWTAKAEDTGSVVYTVFSLDDEPVAGMVRTPADLPDDVPDSWSAYFNVADCKAAEGLATHLGGWVILPATPTPAGPFAVLSDPNGAAFQVMEITGEAP